MNTFFSDLTHCVYECENCTWMCYERNPRSWFIIHPFWH